MSPRFPKAGSPRAARTRGALISAGLELLADRPVDAIPIDELVAAAGVAKGSFFNHFADKQDFADTVAAEIRQDIEERVAALNDGVSNPLERLAGGMITAAAFALSEPKRASVLARTARGMMIESHPLNRGISEDVRACCAADLICQEGARTGVLYWLGCCQALMGGIIERNASVNEAAMLLRDMLVLGLAGLGADTFAKGSLIQSELLRSRLQALISQRSK